MKKKPQFMYVTAGMGEKTAGSSGKSKFWLGQKFFFNTAPHMRRTPFEDGAECLAWKGEVSGKLVTLLLTVRANVPEG